jgi:hypothetical protein
MNAGSQFNSFLSEFIRPALKAQGFRKNGQTFAVFETGNWGIVNFQKSTSSTSQLVKFTINLGVASARLSLVSTEDWRRRPPRMYDCDWQPRLGLLMADADDHWWVLDDQTLLPALADEVIQALMVYGLPAMRRVLNDEGLRDLYLSGHGGWLSNRQRLDRVIRLVREIGPHDRLSELIAEQEQAERRAPAEAAEFSNLVAGALSGAGFERKPGTEHEWIAPADWSERASLLKQDPDKPEPANN